MNEKQTQSLTLNFKKVEFRAAPPPASTQGLIGLLLPSAAGLTGLGTDTLSSS